MSFELSLSHVCPHRTQQEHLSLDLTDRRSLRPLRPPANESVQLWVNGYLVDSSNTVWGYDLIQDPLRIDHGKKLYFRKRIKSSGDLFELSYNTTATNCRRCAGLRIEDDIFFNPLGLVVTLEEEQKLTQDMRKFVITQRASNHFHPYVGTSITELIGTKISDSGFVEVSLTEEVVDTLENLKSLQLQQQTVQLVTDKEFIFRVILVDVKQSKIDPSVFNILIVAVNKAGETCEIEQTISVPGAQNLLFGDPRGMPGDTNYLGSSQNVR